MSLAASFLAYSSIVILSSVLVLLGILGVGRLSPRSVTVLGIAWVTTHVVLGASGASGSAVLSSLLVMGSSVFIAILLARTASTPGALVALAATASIVDIVSFSGGATRWLLSSESGAVSSALRYLTVTLRSDAGLAAVVGIGDLAFLGTFYLGLVREGRRPRTACTSLVGALLVALAVGLAVGGAFGIPFMAVAVVALSRKRAEDSVSEPCPS